MDDIEDRRVARQARRQGDESLEELYTQGTEDAEIFYDQEDNR